MKENRPAPRQTESEQQTFSARRARASWAESGRRFPTAPKSESPRGIPEPPSHYERRNVITADCRDGNDLTTQQEADYCNHVTASDGGSCSLKWVYLSAQMYRCNTAQAQQMAQECLTALSPAARAPARRGTRHETQWADFRPYAGSPPGGKIGKPAGIGADPGR